MRRDAIGLLIGNVVGILLSLVSMRSPVAFLVLFTLFVVVMYVGGYLIERRSTTP